MPPKLIAAYKLFSGTHLLKLLFANDSNSLNREFYGALLYLMGLEQYEVRNKKLIGRRSRVPKRFQELRILALDAATRAHHRPQEIRTDYR